MIVEKSIPKSDGLEIFKTLCLDHNFEHASCQRYGPVTDIEEVEHLGI